LSANVSLRQTIFLAPTVPCSDEPGVTPQECESLDNKALKARFSAKMSRAFSADAILLNKSWDVAPGWQWCRAFGAGRDGTAGASESVILL